ncbi:hypothetical protein THRCLA_06118 [Thraustotheca clavata]|uniref:Uncharacterized protein n=1 Tax=Thraustotheca clavata TaxID=74557 RepID=A0A1V9ZR25_9STRA|nr:hypothetical protein THRCLA_06118 [Thraustotheca clavata]
MYTHQRIASFVLVFYTLVNSQWSYDQSSLTYLGLWTLSGAGVSIKLVDAGVSKLGYDVVDPSKWPASSSAYCAIDLVAGHDPWCFSAASAARTFHVVAFLCSCTSLVIAIHVVLKRPFPTWDGAGAEPSLPWAIFLCFVQGINIIIVITTWTWTQYSMNLTCIQDGLAKKTCVIDGGTIYFAIAHTALAFLLFGIWRVSYKWLEAKKSGALMDSFILAAKTDDLDETLAAIAGRVEINALGSDGRNALHWAAALNRSSVVHVLLKKGANISAHDRDGWTPLHWASRMGNPDIVRLLVKNGADVNAKDSWGTTPLMLSVLGKSKTSAMCLLELGAIINAKNVFGQTALMMCAEEDAELHGFVVMLLNAGASCKIRDVQGMNVLHYAAGAGLKNIVSTLIECCENDEIEQLSKFGDSPLQEARLRYRKSTSVLLERNPNAIQDVGSDEDTSSEYELNSASSYSSDEDT